MTTPPIELAATVERIERKAPPEPEGWIGLAYKSLSEEWQIDRSFLWSNREDAIESLRSTHYENEHRLVRISPAPSPAETGAVPVEVALAIELRIGYLTRRSAQAMELSDSARARQLEGERDALRAWLATQKGTR